MVNSKLRNGRITSSEVVRLVNGFKNGKLGSTGINYLEEVILERELKRGADVEAYSQALDWGKLMEIRLFNLLGLNYSLEARETLLHPKYGEYISGTPDFRQEKVTSEAKCYYPKNFAKLTRAINSKDINELKELKTGSKPKGFEYWQVVANSLLTGTKEAELISYMPYVSEAKEIHEMLDDPEFYVTFDLKPWRYEYLHSCTAPDNMKLDDFPFLPDDSSFKNLNKFRFTIPQEDKIFLTKVYLESIKYIKENGN